MTIGADLDLWSSRIERALTGQGIRSVYQPIVDLPRRKIVGFEALTRFDEVDGQYFAPDVWFAAAVALDVAAELDAVTLRSALCSRPDLPQNCFLSLNVDPQSLMDRVVVDVLTATGKLGGVLIEITEHRPWNWSSLGPAVERLRSAGAMFAVDDAGAGYSGLQQILQLRPAILKLDRGIVDGIDRDEAKRALVEMLGIFASRIDAWVLAEGVETVAEAQTLLDLEVPLVQGYYFARPGPMWPTIDPIAVTELQQIPTVRQDTLHRLADPTPAVCESEPIESFVASDADWIAVVDDDQRPLGVLSSAGAVSGILTKTLIANVHSSPKEVGQRMATSIKVEPGVPAVVVDNSGRYLGLLSMRRLIRALSADESET